MHHHDRVVLPREPSLEEQRNGVDHDRPGRRRRDPPSGLGTHQRMHDRLEAAALIGVREHDGSAGAPDRGCRHRATTSEPNASTTCSYPCGAWLDHLASEIVGLDADGAASDELAQDDATCRCRYRRSARQ